MDKPEPVTVPIGTVAQDTYVRFSDGKEAAIASVAVCVDLAGNVFPPGHIVIARPFRGSISTTLNGYIDTVPADTLVEVLKSNG